jgi:hypothetical protein
MKATRSPTQWIASPISGLTVIVLGAGLTVARRARTIARALAERGKAT